MFIISLVLTKLFGVQFSILWIGLPIFLGFLKYLFFILQKTIKRNVRRNASMKNIVSLKREGAYGTFFSVLPMNNYKVRAVGESPRCLTNDLEKGES